MLKRVEQILIKTKKKTFSEFVGDNVSTFVGEGFDFSGLKEYETSDDARKIDWLSLAKTNELFVREFYEEKKLNIVTIALLSGSMYFGTEVLKQQSVADIVATIGYSCIKNNDIFNCTIFQDKDRGSAKNIKSIPLLYKHMNKIATHPVMGKSIDYKNLGIFLDKKIKQKSLIFLIGDFLDGKLDLMFPKRHEFFVIVLRDKFEERPKPLGEIETIDPNNNSRFESNLSDYSIKKYSFLVEQNDKNLYETLKKKNMRFTKIYNQSNKNFATDLKRLFV
jgi:uncharacterized protein (DUF58 family)